MSELRDLYDRVIDLPAAERDGWLDANCPDALLRARVRVLLDAQADTGPDALGRPAAERLAQLDPGDDALVGLDQWIGRRVGAFRLVRLIGEGGMAAVFLAEREGADFVQCAAVKLLRRGLFSSVEQQLFRRERQMLAALSHPHIARLIDGGIAEGGVPFLAMEYVEGLPITRHCETHRLGVRERIALVAEACRAVDAAHHALIVHRDIKPSNLLVDTDGAVKLLDFGIAKLIHAEDEATRTGFGAMTPEYAAPEQFVGGPITTATDVYALGVLLHELVLGERPLDSPPTRPSSRTTAPELDDARLPAPRAALRSLLRGDLDNVLLKALEREPERRYASAGALADELDRYLEGRPVAAHPPSTWYRTRKFVQRHRGGVAVTALLAAGLVAGVLATIWQTHVARQQALRANAVRDFLVAALDASKAELPRDQRPDLDELMKAARARIDVDRSLDEQTRAELLHTLGEIALSLNDLAGAKALLGQAIEIRARTLPPGSPELLRSQVRLGQVLVANRELEAGRKLFDEIMPRVAGQTGPVAADAWANYGAALVDTGDAARAVDAAQRAATLADAAWGPSSREALSLHMMVGDALAKAGRKAEAARLLEPAIAGWRAAGLPVDNKLAVSMANLGNAKFEAGDNAGAIVLLEQVIELRRRIFKGPHDAIALALGNLGSVYIEQNELDRATALYTEALEMRRTLFGDAHAALVPTLANLGSIARKRRDFATAQDRYSEALRICETTGTTKTAAYPTVMHNLAYTQLLARDFDAAEQTEQRALAIYRGLYGERHNATGTALALLAQIAADAGRPGEALERVDAALAILEGDRNSAPQALALSRYTRAQALYALDRGADASAQIDAVIDDWRKHEKKANDRLMAMLALRAKLERARGDAGAARRTAAEALALPVERSLVSPETVTVLEALAK